MSKERLWVIDPEILDSVDMTATEFMEVYRKLVSDGLLTETTPETELHGPTFALSFMPLDNPENFSEEVRKQHEENMRKWAGVSPYDLLKPRH
jgi:hypothetical protein